MTGIREGTSADIERLREIQTRALAEPWPELLETACHGPPPLYVLEDGEVVGYVIVLAEKDSVAYVPELAVHPDCQGQGYGSELVSFLFAHLDDEEFTEVRLTVQADDARARGFYDSHGFTEQERLAGHFESSDGLLLARSL